MSACLRTKKKWEAKDETAFMRNGRMLLEELIASSNGRCNPIHGFSAEELKRATNSYDTQQVLRETRYYKFYTGFLQCHPVLIKMFKNSFERCKFVFNEIVIASQMSVHKNVLKLIGCCLETQVPILVFEFAESGNLASRIFEPNKTHFQPLRWIYRLKIAMDIANAVAYLHTAFPRPIIHRNISCSNILLNENYVAKLSDFSLSVSIPEGESNVKDGVRGTIGLIAPEYLATGCFSEKHDVFSFGVLLFMLLTGQREICNDPFETTKRIYLVDYVRKYVENDRFNEILDPILEEEEWLGKEQQLQAFRALALRCVSKTAEDRPTMIDVAKQLRQIDRPMIPP